MDKCVYPMIMELTDKTYKAWAVDFPKEWRRILSGFNTVDVTKENFRTRYMDMGLTNWLPSCVFTNPIKRFDYTPDWLLLEDKPSEESMEMLRDVVSDWICAESQKKDVEEKTAGKMREFAKSLDASAFAMHEIETNSKRMAIFKAVNALANKNFLVNSEFPDGEFILRHSGRNTLTSEVITAYREGYDNAYYAIGVTLSPISFFGDNRTYLRCDIVKRRWIREIYLPPKKDKDANKCVQLSLFYSPKPADIDDSKFPFQANDTHAYIMNHDLPGMDAKKYFKIPIKVYGEDRVWSSQDLRYYNYRFRHMLTLPDINDLYKDPVSFIEGNPIILLPYAAVMGDGAFNTGMKSGLPMKSKKMILDEIRENLHNEKIIVSVDEIVANVLDSPGKSSKYKINAFKKAGITYDFDRKTKPKSNSQGEKPCSYWMVSPKDYVHQEEFRHWVSDVAAPFKLEFVACCGEDKEKADFLRERVTFYLGEDAIASETKVMPDLFRKLVAETGMNGRAFEISRNLGKVDCRTGMFIVIPPLPKLDKDRKKDPKNAIRKGCVKSGRLAQFLTNDKHYEDRVDNAIYDMLRQMGVVIPAPIGVCRHGPKLEYLEEFEKIPFIGMEILARQAKKGEPLLRFPVYVKFDGKSVSAKSPLFFNGEWTDYPNMLLALGKIENGDRLASFFKDSKEIAPLIQKSMRSLENESREMPNGMALFIRKTTHCNPMEVYNHEHLRQSRLRLIEIDVESPDYYTDWKEKNGRKNNKGREIDDKFELASGIFRFGNSFFYVPMKEAMEKRFCRTYLDYSDSLINNSWDGYGKRKIIGIQPLVMLDGDNVDDFVRYTAGLFGVAIQSTNMILNRPMPLHLASQLDEYLIL